MTDSNLAHDLRPKPAPDDLELPTLPEVADRKAYPLDALGELLGSAARDIAKCIMAPPELAAQSVLSIAAFAAQDKANVGIDGRTYPLSLFALTVAESGDRKSACDRVASRPLEQWQREHAREHRTALKKYHDEKDAYDAVRRKIASDGKKHKTQSEKVSALAALTPPVRPTEPLVIAQEPTLEGLQRSFRLGRPSQALFNDEGGQFFGGHAMNKDNMLKTIAGLSKYWDGAPIYRTRAAEGETSAMYERRLSVHLLVQPRVAADVLSDRMLLEQGLLARFLIAESRTLAGTRLMKEDQERHERDAEQQPSVQRFQQRIAGLLEIEPCLAEDGGLELPCLTLDERAYSLWVHFYNETEREQGPGRELEIVKPHASKTAEQALRLAGVFAVLEDTQAITRDQMQRAWTLAIYYLLNALRSAQLAEQDHAHRQARELLEWLRAEPGARATIDHMQKRLPHKLRRKVADLRAMLALLEGNAAVRVIEHNTRGDACAWEVASQ